jgi:hypothetical protein
MKGFISSARVGADFHSVCVLSALQGSMRGTLRFVCVFFDSVCVLSALTGRLAGTLRFRLRIFLIPSASGLR